jgi:hypothetical protein
MQLNYQERAQNILTVYKEIVDCAFLLPREVFRFPTLRLIKKTWNFHNFSSL